MASIAHIGYGYWGKNLARNFSELGVLKAIIDPDPKAAAAAAAALGVKAISFEDMLAAPGIDAVSIASPAEMHFSHAMAALEAGKHVYVEKPLALDIGEAERLHAEALRRGLTLMVGHLLQYHPVYVRLRAMVEEGELGRLLYVYSNRLSLGKFRREENVLWSFAPHDISMVLGLFGDEPSHVTAQGNVSYTPGIADMVTMQMHFPGGGSGHVQVSWMHPFKEQRLVVIGEKAMAVFEDSQPDWEQKLKLYRHRIDCSGPVPIPEKADAEAITVPRSEPLRNECAHFIACVDEQRKPITDGVEGLAVLRCLQKAELALRDNLGHQAAR
ncbi:Gfo/Idh/MocA family oxidoreductase [Pseudaminobacter arsenicus]|uniref:Gfo/Idh/MocA family oxidoreductase n=1 Tax=Borborobacter arsenicus TaxID=1851146 RepID=A0A432V9K9_9HYPH|nr:Gfo/Idh/MocA family oxidoreductase [Pseudaminobacter arsenicus]RUM98888.1 Gfo/Idh/MocA family oxidoreductase [Pseudaminobacter arsenicus]